MAVGSALLVIICGILFASLYATASGKVAVLEVSRTVPSGAAVTARDLKSVNVSVSMQGSTIPASHATSLVGKSAAVTLPAGSILIPSDFTRSWQPPAGESLVGVALRQSQEPASGVQPGEYVDVILTGAPGAAFQAAETARGQLPSSAGAATTTGSVSLPASGSAPSQQQGSAVTLASSSSVTSQGSSGSSIARVQASSGVVGSVLASRVKVTDVMAGSQSAQSSKVLVSLLVPSVLAPDIVTASSAGQVAVTVTRTHQ
ncbi:MAG: RcpC/CpaB family pilus assembly protein [Acidimicrobiales bacterium]